MNSATQSFLGRYRLVKVLGQGAMGVVYEAVDTRLNRTVAIKTVLRSHLADETTANEYATRFEREAQAAARLTHPHVVTVFDFGEHEDISYIVMEFIRGRELNQAFEAGQHFPLSEAIRIMRELLSALDYAHQQGIVHRDIKPANVMLDPAGRVKLTDFGVARVANANQDRTMPGTLVGTPSYMSPEQILGLAVGSRADIFAAGVILYQFLTGRRPFTGGWAIRRAAQDRAGRSRPAVEGESGPARGLRPDHLACAGQAAREPLRKRRRLCRRPRAHRRQPAARSAADRPRPARRCGRA
jgi:serine/threonine protein kinase